MVQKIKNDDERGNGIEQHAGKGWLRWGKDRDRELGKRHLD